MTERKNFDSEFCGRVPLQHINLIQSYGYLLVVDRDDTIIQASENCAELLGKKINEIVNTKLAQYIAGQSAVELQAVAGKGITDRVPFNLRLQNGAQVQALLHFKKDYLILEAELTSKEEERYFTSVFQDIKHSIAAIEQAATVQEVCEVAISELKKISGFDGVLMYQFDKDWNGTVIAEIKDKRLDPYMGQTFPASDIPRQARELYLKNPYRLIPNREYTPVRLFPVINPVTNSFIDLSDCNLRSVPAVHLEYMGNMGIKASMSIRVIRNGQLWGLISCHNIEAVDLSLETCSIFELLSSVISNKISSILNKHDFDYASSLQGKKNLLIEQVYAKEDMVQGVIEAAGENLMTVFDAGGAAVMFNGQLETIGKTPEADSIENILLWLEGKKIDRIFSSNCLSGIYEEAAAYADVGSGLLAIPIDAAKGEYMLCFRPEVIETINWGGDPNNAITFEPDGKNYHPRNSFKLWQQQVKNNSKPWHSEELTVAESLRSFLFEFKTRQMFN
ncbi:MAG TPA: GAF domain-containing protein [Mucilaginibacter sp.]|nr:GAF domain-containing protein [Mucilaginibacter sp.]